MPAISLSSASLPLPPRVASPGADRETSLKVGPWARPGADLSALRARIRRLESGAAMPGNAASEAGSLGMETAERPSLSPGALPPGALPLGAAALDTHLPGGGLPLGCLHEIEGARVEWDDAAATGFALALLARLCAAMPISPAGGVVEGGAVLWITPWRDLYAPGVAAFGLDPGRLILVRAGSETDVLWAMEEGLRCPRLIAVVGEVDGLDRAAGRRLQLAARASGVTAFALRRQRYPARRAEAPSAALTRWRIAPMSSTGASSTGAESENATGGLLGRPSWQAELLRCRGAAPGQWHVEWDDATSGFALAAPFRDGPVVAEPARSEFAGTARQRAS